MAVYVAGRQRRSMNLLSRLREIMGPGTYHRSTVPDSCAVRDARDEIARHRIAKSSLASKLDLDRTGFLLGDAALARVDRRYLPKDFATDDDGFCAQGAEPNEPSR